MFKWVIEVSMVMLFCISCLHVAMIMRPLRERYFTARDGKDYVKTIRDTAFQLEIDDVEGTDSIIIQPSSR
jgi:hypothetical protein